MTEDTKTASELSPIIAKFYFALQTTTKEMSKSRLIQSTGIKDIVIKPLSSNDLSFDHWIITMMMGCPGINIVFSCHFSTKVARDLTLEKFPKKKLTAEDCHEFLSEYCNLTVGGIKNALSTLIPIHCKRPSESTITPPEYKPSYDEVKIDTSNSLTKHYWLLSWNEGSLICSVTLNIKEKDLNSAYNGNIENLIAAISTFQVDDTGDIELFGT